MNILAQVIGYFGLATVMISFQQNTKKRILFCQIISGVFFTVHFILLKGNAGALINFVGVLRAMVFFNRDKNWGKHFTWPYIFILMSTGAGIIAWKNIYDIFPMISMVFSGIGLWQTNPKYTRIFALLASPFFFTYNISKGSQAGIISEIFCSISIIIAIYRYDIKKKTLSEKAVQVAE